MVFENMLSCTLPGNVCYKKRNVQYCGPSSCIFIYSVGLRANVGLFLKGRTQCKMGGVSYCLLDPR